MLSFSQVVIIPGAVCENQNGLGCGGNSIILSSLGKYIIIINYLKKISKGDFWFFFVTKSYSIA